MATWKIKPIASPVASPNTKVIALPLHRVASDGDVDAGCDHFDSYHRFVGPEHDHRVLVRLVEGKRQHVFGPHVGGGLFFRRQQLKRDALAVAEFVLTEDLAHPLYASSCFNS